MARDAAIAAPVAAFVLRVVCAELDRQLGDRRGYRGALDPATLCPWCETERVALEAAVDGAPMHGRDWCQPHAEAVSEAARGRFLAQRPFAPGTALAPPETVRTGEPSANWWSNAVQLMWERMQRSCAACDAASEASGRRESFLRAGPRPNEHWDIPSLCPAHDAALSHPRGEFYDRVLDGTVRECAWCAPMTRAADRTVTLFTHAYGVEAFRLAYASLPGLCLPHAADATKRLDSQALSHFATSVRARMSTMIWELEERAARRSWQLRDQGALPRSDDIAERAWWLIAGGTPRAGVFVDGR